MFVKALTLLIFSMLSTSLFAEGSGQLFVSSEKDASIMVLDGKTHAVIKKISTAARPRHMIFNSDKTQIYVACGDGNAIDIIDVATLSLIDRIDKIDDPEVIELSADGKTLYLSLEDEGALGILDLDTYFSNRKETPELTVGESDPNDDRGDGDESGEEEEDEENEGGEGATVTGLSKVEVGLEPEGILISPDGTLTYVTSEVANTVHIVDNNKHQLINSIVVGNRPRRFALIANKNELWVSNELSSSISIIDVSSNEIIDTIEFLPPGFRKEDVTPVGITLTNDTKTVIVALGRANHVAFVDTKTRKIEDYVLVGTRAWNTALSADNSTLYVVNGLSDDVSVIDMSDRRAKTSFAVGRVPYMLLIDD